MSIKGILCANTILSTVLIAGVAHAQTTPVATTSEDIVVTATRTESLLSKTPIAMSALSGENLAEQGITNPTQLADSLPNVAITVGNGLQVTIRGVTSNDGTEKGDPSAAFLLDGIYLARPQSQEVSFFDVARVEVLRGPQGTLYGRNSTAGVLNLITQKPKYEFESSVNASYESFNHINTTGVINVPLADTFAARLAVNYDRRDSYTDKRSADNFTLDPARDNLSARLSFGFTPTDTFDLVVRADYSQIKGVPGGAVPTTNFFSGGPDFVPQSRLNYIDGDSEDQRITPNGEAWQPSRDNTEQGVMAEANLDVGAATLTYLGSYREREFDERTSFNRGANRVTFAGDGWQASHELRAAFGGDGPLQAQVGAYYFKEESGIALFLYDLLGPGTAFGFPQDPTISETKGLFGQGTLEVAPGLKLTAGVRYSSDDKSRVGATVLDIVATGARTVFQINDASRNFNETTWRVGADYDIPDVGLLYGSVSTGYKAGGFNDGCEARPGAPPACTFAASDLYYDPETLTAYEAGWKFRLFDSRLSFDASVFHYDYQDLQLSSVSQTACGGGPCQLTSNAAAAKIDGAEFEAIWRPAENHRFNFSLNFLNARYEDFDPTPTVSFDGRPLARSPESSGIAGYTFTQPLSDGGVFEANVSTRYSAEYDITDLANFVYFYQPSYTKTDASLTYRAPEDRFLVQAYVRNIEDNLALTGAGSGINGTANFDEPRVFGVRIGANF